MKVLIVGLGSIGTRHARIFKERLGCEVTALRVKGRGNDLGIPELRSWREAAAFQPDVAVISNPTGEHVKTAIFCAKLGAHLFIEKPLSGSLKGIEELRAVCRLKKRACYVAYPLRFHPVVRKAKEILKGLKPFYARVVCASYLPNWRSGRDVKTVYSAKRKEGGGVLLDLSHEFDYLQYLLGPFKAIAGVLGRISGVTLDAEDFVDVVVLTKSDVHVNVHLDYFSRTTDRWFHIDLPDGFLCGDLVANYLRVSRRGREKVFQFKMGRDDYFTDQARYFVKNLKSGRMMNSLDEAVPLLKQILEFRHG